MIGLLRLGLLAGAGYYLYKKMSGDRARSSLSTDPWRKAQRRDNDMFGRLKRTLNDTMSSGRPGGRTFGVSSTRGKSSAEYDMSSIGQPREAKAAEMAAQPAPPPRGEFGAPMTDVPTSR